ncbi:DUF1189 domain-containing protein [Bacillus infantis]|uniref:DUF1189 domain-containing protein n=1 Tax=Bacillus infantis TaxID=324767 RepID=UPI003CFB9E12
MNVFKQFFKSLYSPRDIAAFRFQGIGKTILYVFLLTLLSVLPTIYYFSTAIMSGADAARESLAEDIPDFTIENGELNSDQKAPIIINKNSFTIVFDSTGTANKEELADSNMALAMLKDEFMFVAGGQVQSYSYSMAGDLTLTKEDAVSFLDSIDSVLVIFIIIMALVIYLFSTAVKFVEVTVLALVGLLLRSIAGRRLQYRHLWRMAAYSITLPTVFFAVMGVLQTNVPSGFMINWFVSIIILMLAIKEVPMPKSKQ